MLGRSNIQVLYLLESNSSGVKYSMKGRSKVPGGE